MICSSRRWSEQRRAKQTLSHRKSPSAFMIRWSSRYKTNKLRMKHTGISLLFVYVKIYMCPPYSDKKKTMLFERRIWKNSFLLCSNWESHSCRKLLLARQRSGMPTLLWRCSRRTTRTHSAANRLHTKHLQPAAWCVDHLLSALIFSFILHVSSIILTFAHVSLTQSLSLSRKNNIITVSSIFFLSYALSLVFHSVILIRESIVSIIPPMRNLTNIFYFTISEYFAADT